MITYQIINEEKFNNADVEMSLTMNAGTFHGEITINGKEFWGEFGANDFVNDYGFKIIQK